MENLGHDAPLRQHTADEIEELRGIASKPMGNKLRRYPAPDKEGWTESWDDEIFNPSTGRSMGKRSKYPLKFPHPSRFALIGPNSVGKTEIVTNLIAQANPPFKRIVCVHADPEYTNDYVHAGLEREDYLAKVPDPSFFDGDEKTLVIIDDLEMRELKSQQRSAISTLYRNISTHKNVSIAMCSQDWSEVPLILKRLSNVKILWRNEDSVGMTLIAKKTGIPLDKWAALWRHLPDFHDSLWIDGHKGSPMPLRKNGFIAFNSPS